MKKLLNMGFIQNEEGAFAHKDFEDIVTVSVENDLVNDFKVTIAQPASFDLKDKIGYSDDEIILAAYEDTLFKGLIEKGFDGAEMDEDVLFLFSKNNLSKEVFINVSTKEYGASEVVQPDLVIPDLYEAVNNPYFDEYVRFFLSLKEMEGGGNEKQ